MEAEIVSKTLDCNFVLKRKVARKDFIAKFWRLALRPSSFLMMEAETISETLDCIHTHVSYRSRRVLYSIAVETLNVTCITLYRYRWASSRTLKFKSILNRVIAKHVTVS
jgi:hypothetical protein